MSHPLENTEDAKRQNLKAINNQERGIAESFGQVIADRDIEIKRLRACIEILMIIDARKNVHLGRARYSGLSNECVGCIAYITLNDGVSGESFRLIDLEEKLEAMKKVTGGLII